MATIRKFEDIEVWQLSRKYASEIYKVTDNCEKFSKDYRLRDQIRASSGSIMDNIAEGYERDGNKELIQYLYIAKGSCGESRSQLYRALDINYIDEKIFEYFRNQAEKISQSISNFIQYLKNSELKGVKYKKE